MNTDMSSGRDRERVEVITGVQRRRRWTPEEKLALVKQTFEPGMTVSLVRPDGRHRRDAGVLTLIDVEFLKFELELVDLAQEPLSRLAKHHTIELLNRVLSLGRKLSTNHHFSY